MAARNILFVSELRELTPGSQDQLIEGGRTLNSAARCGAHKKRSSQSFQGITTNNGQNFSLKNENIDFGVIYLRLRWLRRDRMMR